MKVVLCFIACPSEARKTAKICLQRYLINGEGDVGVTQVGEWTRLLACRKIVTLFGVAISVLDSWPLAMFHPEQLACHCADRLRPGRREDTNREDAKKWSE